MEGKMKSNKEVLAISRIGKLLEGMSFDTKLRILEFIAGSIHEEKHIELEKSLNSKLDSVAQTAMEHSGKANA
jgi:predicted chitinase